MYVYMPVLIFNDVYYRNSIAGDTAMINCAPVVLIVVVATNAAIAFIVIF